MKDRPRSHIFTGTSSKLACAVFASWTGPVRSAWDRLGCLESRSAVGQPGPMRSLALALLSAGVCAMQREERRALREEVRDLFTHAWDNYMEHAFPMDVLLPMSCKGSDGWGGMSMTVLDTLDTLAIMGNASEFERMVNWCIAHIDFDIDETVSVFETNIRALGGLISAHLLAIDPRLGLMSGPCASGLEVARLPTTLASWSWPSRLLAAPRT